MRLLISPSNEKYLLVGFDTETGEVASIRARDEFHDHNADPTRPSLRPFGITWDCSNLFIANRSDLLIFDQSMQLQEKLEGILGQNTHQIAYRDGEVIAALPRRDCISFTDVWSLERRFFNPFTGWLNAVPESKDQKDELYHINSVTVKGDLVYMLLHNRGDRCSQIAILDMRTGLTEWVVDTPCLKAHNLYVGPEGLGVLDTGGMNNLWLGRRRYTLYVSGAAFTRGLAGNSGGLACGHFQKQPRRSRGAGGSSIKIFARGDVQESHYISGIGAINDMRAIDVEDCCHNNPYKCPVDLWSVADTITEERV